VTIIKISDTCSILASTITSVQLFQANPELGTKDYVAVGTGRYISFVSFDDSDTARGEHERILGEWCGVVTQVP
jgi:hypothetical protein